MSTIRHRVSAMATVAAVLIGTAACSSDSSISGGGSGKTSDSVEVAVFGYDDGVQAWADSTMKSFNDQNKGYQLKITVVPANSLQQLLNTRVQGGNPPDISSMPTAWIPAFAQAGAVIDLRSPLGADFLGTFNKNLLDGSVYDGKLLSLPYGSSTRALFYNKDQFAKAGIAEPPKTWDELVTDAQKLTASGAAKYGFALQGTGNETFAAWFPYFYWSYGGDFGTDTKINVDQGACTSAMTQLADMVRKHKVTQPNPTSTDAPQLQDLFVSGQAAMTISGPWLSAPSKDISFGVAPVPAGTTSSTLGVADGWAVFDAGKAAKSQDVEVLKFLMSDPVEVPLIQGRGFLPVIDATFANSAFTGPTVKPFVDALGTAKFAPLSPNWTKLADQGAKAMQSMYVNGTSPADTCKALAGLG